MALSFPEIADAWRAHQAAPSLALADDPALAPLQLDAIERRIAGVVSRFWAHGTLASADVALLGLAYGELADAARRLDETGAPADVRAHLVRLGRIAARVLEYMAYVRPPAPHEQRHAPHAAHAIGGS